MVLPRPTTIFSKRTRTNFESSPLTSMRVLSGLVYCNTSMTAKRSFDQARGPRCSLHLSKPSSIYLTHDRMPTLAYCTWRLGLPGLDLHRSLSFSSSNATLSRRAPTSSCCWAIASIPCCVSPFHVCCLMNCSSRPLSNGVSAFPYKLCQKDPQAFEPVTLYSPHAVM